MGLDVTEGEASNVAGADAAADDAAVHVVAVQCASAEGVADVEEEEVVEE